MDFKDKVVVITGSSSGIGAATAQYFANLSAKVVMVGRNEENLNNVAQTVEDAKGIKPLIIKADLANDDDVKKVIETTIEHFGRIDVLVNNAGANIQARLKDGVDPFDNMISINLRSIYLLSSLAAPYLIKTKGNVVNVSSVLSVKPCENCVPYCIAKAGLDMFTRCAAKELANHGVRVNSVNPGLVKTNILRSIGMTKENVDIFFNNAAKKNPLGFICTSEDVAEMIMFLASDKARSLTGNIQFMECGELLV